MTDDCIEPYRECVRSRQERVRQAIEANPAATKRQLATLAGVSERTIQAARNFTLAEGEKAFSPNPTVKLKDLYDPDIDYWQHRAVKLFQSALWQASRADLAFIWDKLLPEFDRELFDNHLKRGRMRHDRSKSVVRQNGVAEENADPHGHG